MKKRKFWNWVRDADTGERTLVPNGQIAEDSWFGDEVTPGIFRDELMKCDGDITVWINSPGGDVFAAAQIYNMLMDYKSNVTQYHCPYRWFGGFRSIRDCHGRNHRGNVSRRDVAGA